MADQHCLNVPTENPKVISFPCTRFKQNGVRYV